MWTVVRKGMLDGVYRVWNMNPLSRTVLLFFEPVGWARLNSNSLSPSCVRGGHRIELDADPGIHESKFDSLKRRTRPGQDLTVGLLPVNELGRVRADSDPLPVPFKVSI